MMTNAILNPVKTLKPYKTKRRSQVKLLHSWRQNTSFGGETLQMVLTDEHVMGKIVSLEPVQTVQVKGEDRKKVQFRLVDSSGKDIACCLWGKYAEQLETYVEREQPLICLIRFAKISFYRGEVQITNAFDASIVYLDPTMEEALKFKEKLMEDKLPLSLIEKRNGKKEVVLQEEDWNGLEIKTISELFVANQLHLIVRDDTETCKLMLLNTVGMTIVGHEAVDLWDGSYDEIEDPDLLPEPIRDLVLMLEVASHNESEECKTPFTKRKEEDADLPDKTSTSKKLCRASIKVEKKKEEGRKQFTTMEIELITISLQRPAKISKHSAMQVSFAQIPSQTQTFHCDQYITDCLRVLKIGLFHVIQIPYISKSACYHPRHQEIYGDCNLDLILSVTKRHIPQNRAAPEILVQNNFQVHQSSKIVSDLHHKKRKENSFRKLPDKRQRKRTSAVLKDITNIDFSLATENQESPTSTVFPDTEFGENIDETCELEFDCSSLDATDSEYKYEDVDLPSSEHDLLNTEKSRAATKGQNKDEYTDEGDPKYTCTHCGAMMWYGERLNKRRNAKIPTFS
ncbi:hypothetical protein HID58_049493, partial [Brassica napus]